MEVQQLINLFTSRPQNKSIDNYFNNQTEKLFQFCFQQNQKTFFFKVLFGVKVSLKTSLRAPRKRGENFFGNLKTIKLIKSLK